MGETCEESQHVSKTEIRLEGEKNEDSKGQEMKEVTCEGEPLTDTSHSSNKDSNALDSASNFGFAVPVPLSISMSKTKTQSAKIISTKNVIADQSSEEQSAVNKRKLSSDPHSSKQLISLPYTEPEWSGVPEEEDDYSFEILKNGQIIDTLALKKKAFFVFGRLPSCDVTLEHPSLSRYHAVIQYSLTLPSHEKGWYIYDLDSTHGTWVNKRRLSPNRYYRLKVGHVVKFGGSTRLHILQVSFSIYSP